MTEIASKDKLTFEKMNNSSTRLFLRFETNEDGKRFCIFSSGRCLLSNFALTPFRTKNTRHRTLQHAYEIEKASFFGDTEAAQLIRREYSPREAMMIAETIQNFDEAKWNDRKDEVMLNLLRCKFTNCLSAKRLLLSTGDSTIVFAFGLDQYWGNGLSEDSSDNCEQSNWKGENQLGQLLMHVRNELADE